MRQAALATVADAAGVPGDTRADGAVAGRGALGARLNLFSMLAKTTAEVNRVTANATGRNAQCPIAVEAKAGRARTTTSESAFNVSPCIR